MLGAERNFFKVFIKYDALEKDSLCCLYVDTYKENQNDICYKKNYLFIKKFCGYKAFSTWLDLNANSRLDT